MLNYIFFHFNINLFVQLTVFHVNVSFPNSLINGGFNISGQSQSNRYVLVPISTVTVSR